MKWNIRIGDVVRLVAGGSNDIGIITEVNADWIHIVGDKINMTTNIKNVEPIGKTLSELVL